MKEDEFGERARDLIRHELQEPERWFWVSFADEDGFRGACIVRAHGLVTATMETHRRGINPGGSVQTMPFPPSLEHLNFTEWANILLSKADVDRYDRWLRERTP